MKLSRIFLSAALITGWLASSALAETYRGGDFTVTIEPSGAYRGCDSKNNCLYIPTYDNRERGRYIWSKGDYTYVMSPLRDESGRYRLKVLAPSGKVILNQVMTPVN